MGAIQQYLDALPHGLDSYPNVKAKVVTLPDKDELAPILDTLPGPVRELCAHAQPSSNWVPEVHASVAHIAVRIAHFSTDDAYVEHCRKRNRRLLSGPLYRHAFRLFRPGRLARLINTSWRLFHRGSSIVATAETTHSLSFVLRTRPRVWPEVVVRALLTSGEEALKIGGTTTAKGTLESFSPTESWARLEW